MHVSLPNFLNPLFAVLQAVSSINLDNLLKLFEGFKQFHYPGIYEVLHHTVSLELLDTKGKKAIYRKCQQVRFLQDNVIAYQDLAWGDGKIFASYKCSPGFPVDRYQEGNCYRTLISLRERKNKGDMSEINIERSIVDGFVKPIEYFQSQIEHRTHHMKIELIFPARRHPKQVVLVQQNSGKTISLSTEHMQILADKRCKLSWATSTPKLFEAYSLRWQW